MAWRHASIDLCSHPWNIALVVSFFFFFLFSRSLRCCTDQRHNALFMLLLRTRILTKQTFVVHLLIPSIKVVEVTKSKKRHSRLGMTYAAYDENSLAKF